MSVMEGWFYTEEDAIHLAIKAFPGSSKNELAGIRDNRLCVRIAAPAEDGRANACMCGFLAKSLGCAKREVVLVKGEKSRLKTVAVPSTCIETLIKITSL